jgi:peroxiredoxin
MIAMNTLSSKLVVRIVIFVAVLATVGIIALGLLRPSQSSNNAIRAHMIGTSIGTAIGDIAPNFTLNGPDGHKVSLSDYRGRPLMLNFWYATCPGCIEETQAMQQFYARQQASGQDFVILGVNGVDDNATATSFTRLHGLTYPLAMDPNQQVETLYNVNYTPTSYFIDRKGIIRAIIVGPVDKATLQQKLAQVSG